MIEDDSLEVKVTHEWSTEVEQCEVTIVKASQELKTDWQPIETAPDDGTMILIAMSFLSSDDHYWKCACVMGEDVHDDTYLDDVGYNASDFTYWKPMGKFPDITKKEK